MHILNTLSDHSNLLTAIYVSVLRIYRYENFTGWVRGECQSQEGPLEIIMSKFSFNEGICFPTSLLYNRPTIGNCLCPLGLLMTPSVSVS